MYLYICIYVCMYSYSNTWPSYDFQKVGSYAFYELKVKDWWDEVLPSKVANFSGPHPLDLRETPLMTTEINPRST